MAAGDLTTLDAVRAYLRGGTVSLPLEDEPLVETLITAVSQIFVEESGRNVLTATYTKTWSGTGSNKVVLDNYPVASVTSVTVDGTAVAARASFTEDGWVLSDPDAGIVELVGSSFTVGVANCVCVYSAGLGATAPLDLSQGIIDQVAYLYRMKDRIGITNESTSAGGAVTYLGGWSAQQGKDGQTPLFEATVSRYRRVA